MTDFCPKVSGPKAVWKIGFWLLTSIPEVFYFDRLAKRGVRLDVMIQYHRPLAEIGYDFWISMMLQDSLLPHVARRRRW